MTTRGGHDAEVEAEAHLDLVVLHALIEAPVLGVLLHLARLLDLADDFDEGDDAHVGDGGDGGGGEEGSV